MSIQKYEAFIKTVELGSFTKAAHALKYTQSNISHMIKDLECEWGVSLIKRTPSGIEITSDGLKLFSLTKNVCELNQMLWSAVEDLHKLQFGIIRLGTLPSIASTWLPKVIKAFQQDYPKIEYELIIDDYMRIEKLITTGRVDCGFLSMRSSSKLDYIFIEEDQMMVIVPEKHPLAECEVFPIKALTQEPFLMFEKTGAVAEITELFSKYALTPNIKFSAWDNPTIMNMVEKGFGISILPALVLRDTSYKIIAKPLEVPLFRNLYVCVKNSEKPHRIVKKFLEYLPYR